MSGFLHKDYYTVLDLTREATKDDIKKAFLEQALKWHPDKAPSDKVEEYTHKYEGLQEAYRILTNEKLRAQYDNALQKTALDLKGEQRDVGYIRSDKYKTSDGRFDSVAFQDDFNKTRSTEDQSSYSSLLQKYNKTQAVSKSEFEQALEARKQELNQIDNQVDNIFKGFTGSVPGQTFDVNVFNRAFDLMKKQDPTSLEEYKGSCNPYNTSALEEITSGLNMNYGVSLTGSTLEDLHKGVLNPHMGAVDLTGLNTGEKYGQETALTKDEIDRRLAEVMADRTSLATLKEHEFVVEPSEMEQLYPELYAPMKVEGLEKPISLPN